MTTKTYGKEDIRKARLSPDVVPAQVEQALFTVPGKGMVLVPLQSATLRFSSEHACYEVKTMPMLRSDPLWYAQAAEGTIRVFDIYRVCSVKVGQVELADEDIGVVAVAFSAATMSLILLKEAVNEVGGQRLNSQPVSTCVYRRYGKRKSIQLTGVEVA